MDHLQPDYGLKKHDLEWRASRLKQAIEEHGGLKTLEHEDSPDIQYHENVSYLDDMDIAVAFFSIGNEMIKTLEKELFKQTFIQSEFRDGTITGYVGKKRRDALNRFDILDDDLQNNMKKCRDFRNALIHEPGKTQRETNIRELKHYVDLTIETVDELESEVQNRVSES